MSAGGRTWQISPALGDLKTVDAGFATTLGSFSNQVNASHSGAITGMRFATPVGTTGSVSVPGVSGSLVSSNGTTIALKNGVAANVAGGTWTLKLSGNGTTISGNATATSSPVPYTGGTGVLGISLLALAAGFVAVML